MDEVPVLLLDIDGVVNAMSKQIPTHVWTRDVWSQARYPDPDEPRLVYPLKWAAPVIEWLTGLHTSHRVEIRWHTTWQHHALEFGELVGLPVFAVQDCPEFEMARENGSALIADLIRACQVPWWKYPAAERVVAQEGRKLVWIDDDIDYKIMRSTRKALKSVHTLELVSPASGTGIITKHIAQVENTLARWEEARGALSGS